MKVGFTFGFARATKELFQLTGTIGNWHVIMDFNP